MTYLLDTNACIDFIRDLGRTRERMKAKPFREFRISSIVYAELVHRAKSSSNSGEHIPAAFTLVGIKRNALGSERERRLEADALARLRGGFRIDESGEGDHRRVVAADRRCGRETGQARLPRERASNRPRRTPLFATPPDSPKLRTPGSARRTCRNFRNRAATAASW